MDLTAYFHVVETILQAYFTGQKILIVPGMALFLKEQNPVLGICVVQDQKTQRPRKKKQQEEVTAFHGCSKIQILYTDNKSLIVEIIYFRIMRKLIVFIIICAYFFTQGCFDGGNRDKGYIHGVIRGAGEGKVFLSELDINSINLLDSAELSEDGSFSIAFRCDSNSIYALQIDERLPVTIIMKGGDTISIDTDAEAKPLEYSVRGNEGSRLMAIYEQHSNRNLHKIDSLRALFEQSRDDPGFFAIRSLIDQAYQEILIDQRIFARNFIEEHPGSFASLVVLNRNFKQIELFDKFEDFSYYTLLDSNLILNYPGNKHTMKHHEVTGKILEKIKKDEIAAGKLSPGNKAPDLKLKGWNGQDYRLSELQGSWVILYFWAAWDARSRQANHELRELYSIYQDRGLEIFAVSLDENERVWKAAIRLDELNCIHVSDLKSINSPVIPLFRVPDKLPYFYLLDRQGIIVWKGHNLGEMEELLLLKLDETS